MITGASRYHREWNCRPWAGVALALTAALSPTRADACLPAPVSALQESANVTSDQQLYHIRPRGTDIAGIIRTGCARSATFKQLVGALQNSDVIVFVEMRTPLPLRGQLTFVVGRAGVRYLRLSLRGDEMEDELIVTLAHELQHAIEVASASRITTSASFRAFYAEYGFSVDGVFCTRDAQRIARVVRTELTARAARRHIPASAPARGS